MGLDAPKLGPRELGGLRYRRRGERCITRRLVLRARCDPCCALECEFLGISARMSAPASSGDQAVGAPKIVTVQPFTAPAVRPWTR